MFSIVMGGSGSGKSQFAEDLVVHSGADQRIYIAAMMPWDEECRQRIERHRQMRAKKQFHTIERYYDLNHLKLSLGTDAVLLECLSNLAANEIYREENQGKSEKDLVNLVLEGIWKVRQQTKHMVVVTNEVFSDGDSYTEETNQYRRILGQINYTLTQKADQVVEVVYSIPLWRKGGGGV